MTTSRNHHRVCLRPHSGRRATHDRAKGPHICTEVRRLSRFGGLDAHRGGVLSIGKLTPGQEGYYLSVVAHGAQDYYLDAGEVPGYWIGAGAAQLGLAGRVGDEAFVALVSGVDPVTGEPLGAVGRRVPAFDLTFSAPKSVSVAWALAGPRIASEIVAAHEAAAAAALGYLEREAVFVRRGAQGAEVLAGSGLIGGAFRHRSSRAGDPQLHTHVVVANATEGPDVRWSALDGRHLYAQARTAGFLYQSQLRAGLTERLSIDWGPVTKGAAELAGVPAGVCAGFSKRRSEILAAAGLDATPGEYQTATLATRPAKNAELSADDLFAGWTARAETFGWAPTEINAWAEATLAQPDLFHAAGLTHPQGPRRPSERASVRPSTASAWADRVLAGLGRELTDLRSSFDRRHVIQGLAGHARRGIPVDVLETLADRFLARSDVVRLGDGRHGPVYSTVELLEIETRMVEHAVARRRAPLTAAFNVDEVLADYPSLTAEQVRMVRAVTRRGGVRVVVGAAGSGKTFALAAANDAWTRDGSTVIGCALAARAARQLQTDTGIRAATLDALLTELERRDRPGLSPQTVVVVDEAAMVGTRKLARLLDLAEHAGAKVVLVGDPRQLTEIEAGGAFAVLGQRLGAALLVANRRQTDPVEREALAALRAGHVNRALDRLAGYGRLTEAASSTEVRDQMIVDWRHATERGDDTIMLARRRADVTDLNQRVLVLRGTLGERTGPRVDTNSGREFATGDRILTLRNDRKHGLVNGDRGTITQVDPTTGSIDVQFDRELQPRAIPAAYVAAGHVDHGYAMTIHKSQGLTCDRAFVLVDDQTHAEAGYTALTRGRHENHLYAIGDEKDLDHHGIDDRPEPIDAVRTALATSEAEWLASSLYLFGHQVPGLESISELVRKPEPRSATIERDRGIDHGYGIEM